MARIQERRKAIELRKQGKTYSEIKSVLRVAKSTLSDWLGNYPLSDEQLTTIGNSIKNKRSVSIERCRETKRKKREQRLATLLNEEKVKLLPLSARELYLVGLFLYWGEGNKRIQGPVSLNNTDPKMVKFFYRWLTESLKVDKKIIKVSLHLYKDMEVDKEKLFWSEILSIPVQQFSKPYIKDSNRVDIDQKGFGHGTCGLVVNNVRLKEKIIQGIEALSI